MKPSLRKRAVSVVAELLGIQPGLDKPAQKEAIELIHKMLLEVRQDTLKDLDVTTACIVECFDARNHRFCKLPVVFLDENGAKEFCDRNTTKTLFYGCRYRQVRVSGKIPRKRKSQ